MFGSAFAEANPTPTSSSGTGTSLAKRMKMLSHKDKTPHGSLEDFVDSDRDSNSDDIANEPEATHKKASCNVDLHKVVISEFTSKTYIGLLAWLYAGVIKFSPLRSSRELITITSSIPMVSPKSIYRLAHLLEIEPLKELALSNFKSQLTIDNVAEEMYSNICGVFEEVRVAALDYASQNWKAVKETDGLKKVHEEIQAGILPYSGMIGAELSMRLK